MGQYKFELKPWIKAVKAQFSRNTEYGALSAVYTDCFPCDPLRLTAPPTTPKQTSNTTFFFSLPPLFPLLSLSAVSQRDPMLSTLHSASLFSSLILLSIFNYAFAEDPFVFYDWKVSYITASPFGVKQQVLSLSLSLSLSYLSSL